MLTRAVRLCRVLLAVVCTMLLGTSGASGAPKPSILFCSPAGVMYYIDLQYLNELRAQGFEVDYTESIAEESIISEIISYHHIISGSALNIKDSLLEWPVGE